MYILGEAWLRLLCFDFDGVRRLSKIVMRSDTEPHASWLRTVSRIASGYAELLQGNHIAAYQCFSQVRDPQITPKFFLHWHWRMFARLGMIEARLQAADIADAQREVDDFLASAHSLPCPNIRAMAWEIKSRVAKAERDFDGARTCIHKALTILDRFDIPVAAWQVHRTAWDLYAGERDRERADGHWARSKDMIMRIADSFDYDEPLRESLLIPPPVVRRVLAVAREGLQGCGSDSVASLPMSGK